MSAQQVVEARLADVAEAQVCYELGRRMRYSALSRTTMNQDGVPIEYVQSVYPGDRYKFVIELKPNSTQIISRTDRLTSLQFGVKQVAQVHHRVD